MQLENVTSDNNNPLIQSLSIQSKDSSYFSFPEELDYSELDGFLSGLDIERKGIGVKDEYLLTLFHQEMSTCSWMKWSSLDHALEKILQWPLLSAHDLGLETKNSAWRRVRPAERSILLKSTWGLVKAYAVQGFVRGLELGLFTSIHIFIYSMLFYRLVKLIQTGSMNVDEFRTSFIGSDQKGIDSLVRLLAGLEAQWLRLILTSPLIIGGLQSISSMVGARRTSSEALNKYTQIIETHLQTGGSWLRDGVYEYLPGISSMGFLSLSGKLQKLESLVRWDGRLSSEERRQIFDALCAVVLKGKKSTQLNALTYLAKIAHGVGFKDLPRLKEASYSTEELITILYTKGKALELLTALQKEEAKESKPLRCQTIQSLPQRLYRQYLLWWLLGFKTHILKQQLPAVVLKGIKLTIEFYFFQMIVLSILEAIRCPDKPGYQFGNGYQDWAADYTAECFTTRISLFRTIDPNESMDALVSEIPQYHLTELTDLILSNKYLTSEEASQIIQAVVRQRASLTHLDLSYNRFGVINEGMFSLLSQLSSLDLSWNSLHSLNNNTFNGLHRLNFLDLSFNTLNVLNDSVFERLNQLSELNLHCNDLTSLSVNAFRGLSQLRTLYLWCNELETLSDGVFSGMSQLNELHLWNNQLQTINGRLFNGLSQLEYLGLANNLIFTLSDDAFSGLNQLKILDLCLNAGITLHNAMFRKLSQLNELYLCGLFLESISDGMFSGLSQLQTLSLEDNLLNTSAMVNVLSQLPASLTGLYIYFNPIDHLPKNFSKLLPSSLQSLSIGGYPDLYVPKILTREFMQNFLPQQLLNLYVIDSNVINIEAGCFLDFTALTSLDLRYNRLHALNNGVFDGLYQLKTLNLGLNPLLYTLGDHVFSGLSQLDYLDLDGNSLSILSDHLFNGLSQLKYLDLSYSHRLSSLSEGMFSELNQLKYLDLSLSRLSTPLSSGVFSGLSQLTILNLSQSYLNTLSIGTFNELNQLQNLLLGFNQFNDTAIINLTQNFPSQLNVLEVQGNLIGNEGALALAKILPCTNLTYVGFGGNLVNNDTAVILATQQNTLRKVCDDERCHANLPASQSCNVSQASSGFSMMTWGRENAVKVTDEDSFADMKSSTASYFYGFFDSHSFTPSSFPSLPSPDSLTKDSLTTAGAMAAAVIGFGLLYKNAMMVRNVVNVGCRLLQQYFLKTSNTLKTSTNHYAFHLSNKTRNTLCTDSHPTIPFSL